MKQLRKLSKNIIQSSSWLVYAKTIEENWDPPYFLLENDLNSPHNSVHHTESISDHTNFVVSNLSSVDYPSLFSELDPRQQSDVKNIMIYAGLLHDIGKPQTGEAGQAKICQSCGTYATAASPVCKKCGAAQFNIVPNTSYISHENVGAESANQFMQNVPPKYKSVIVSLIKDHMVLGRILAEASSGSFNSKAFAKVIRRGNIGQSGISPEVYAKMAILLSLVDGLSRISSASSPSDEINGLLGILGIQSAKFPQYSSIEKFPMDLFQKILPGAIEGLSSIVMERMHLLPPVQRVDQSIGEIGGPGISQKISEFLAQNGVALGVSDNTGKSELFSSLAKLGRTELVPDILSIFSGS